MAFSFIQITDHHLTESDARLSEGFSTWHAFRAVLRHIAAHYADVDFVVSTGDLVHRGSDAEYRFFREQLGLRETSAPPGPQRVSVEGLREMPMYFLPGNHDPREAFFRHMFPQASERAMNVTFDYGGVQIICLDWGDQNKAVASAGLFDHLAGALRSGRPSLIWTHHAVAPVGRSMFDVYLPDDVGRLGALIQGQPVLAILQGHFHATYESELSGIPVYGLRSTTFTLEQVGDQLLHVLRPPHYRIVRVGEGRVSTEIVEVPL